MFLKVNEEEGAMMGVKSVSLQDKKSIIIDFLKKCNLYSDQKLLDYERRMNHASEHEGGELLQKKHDWTSYRDFNRYTIEELSGDELDDWL